MLDSRSLCIEGEPYYQQSARTYVEDAGRLVGPTQLAAGVRPAEDEINRHLRLEIDTLRSPARIERLATDRLGMVAPAAGDATVIERVTSTPPPPKSVVARR